MWLPKAVEPTARLRALEKDPAVSGGYARTIYGDVRAVFSAAVDDGLILRNPCLAPPGRPAEQRRVVPWLPEQVHAAREALPQRYRPMVDMSAGCGLRQGEIMGLAEDAVDFASGIVRVDRAGAAHSGQATEALRARFGAFEPVEITLPWPKPDGPKVSARLLFTNTASCLVWRSDFNVKERKPAPAADGKYESPREHGSTL
jgi:integrase